LTKFGDLELKHELRDSKICLSNLLGKEITSLCFPIGYFSDKVIKTAFDCGYEQLYTSLPGNYYDNIREKLHTRNLVQFATPQEIKYRLRGNAKYLCKRAVKLHCKTSICL
jgi:peptidoglycan/xylan/chitin deacetylase (PgdA/CDA1 family)